MTFTMTPQDVYWMGKAEDAIRDDGFKFWMVGGGVGAVGAGAILNPLVGVFVAGASLMQSWAANEASSNDLDAIDRGIVAHLLGQRDFEEYLEYRGVNGVLWELMEAQRRKLEIKPAGRKFLKGQLGQKTLVEQAKALMAPAQHSAPAPKPESVGISHGSPAPIQPEEVSPPFPQWDESLDEWQPTDLPQAFIPYLASQIHILIAATTGSGKTWVLRNLCTHLANRSDLLCIADPKGTQWGELEPAAKFMQAGDDYLRLFDRLSSELNRRRTLLSQGKPVGKHLWVVLDEWFLVQAEAKTMENADRVAMENLLVKLIAAGRELNLHLIMVGQSHLLGDLSLSGGKNTFSSGLRDSICVLALGCKETTDHEGKPMVGSAKTIEGVLTDQYLIKNKGDRDAAQQFHSALRRQPAVNRTYCIYSSQLFIGQTPDLTIPDMATLATFPETAPAIAPETMSEVKQLILAILEAKGEPMLASEIRQQSAALKKLTTEQVGFALDRMATDDGFVVGDGGTPPRYALAAVQS